MYSITLQMYKSPCNYLYVMRFFFYWSIVALKYCVSLVMGDVNRNGRDRNSKNCLPIKAMRTQTKIVKVNISRILEIKPRLAVIQGVFVLNQNTTTTNNWLNHGKNRNCGILIYPIPISSPQIHSGLESQQPHNHTSHERQQLRSQYRDQNAFRAPPKYHPLRIIII